MFFENELVKVDPLDFYVMVHLDSKSGDNNIASENLFSYYLANYCHR